MSAESNSPATEPRKNETFAGQADETLFERAMSDAAIGMAIVSLDGRWIKVNDAVCTFFGYPREELLDLSFQDITYADDLFSDLDLLNATLEGKISNYRLEKRYIHKSGAIVWALLVVSLVRTSSGAPKFFISQIEDIDERKRAEVALADSESRWNFALEAAGHGVWDRNLKTGTLYRSPLWYRMLGYEPSELPVDGRTWIELVHPDDRAIVESADRDAYDDDTQDTRSEIRMRHKDGHWVWILNRGRVAERDSAGNPVRFIGTHTDITERKAREERLRAANERVELAVQAGNVGIWELDLASGRVTWDERMYQLYGITPDQFDNTRPSWRRLIHSDDVKTVTAAMDAVIAERGRTQIDFRIVRGDGSIRHIRALAQIPESVPGDGERLIGTQWDITDHKNLSDELFEEKERLRITLHSIGDAVVTTDVNMAVTFMNPIAERLTGWTYEHAEGMPLIDVFRIVNAETRETVRNPIEECLERMQPFYLQAGTVLISRSGQEFFIQDSAAPVRTSTGEVIGAVLVFQDVTHARAMQEELVHAAMHDSLTGLPNRRSFEQTLEELCRETEGRTSAHTLCFIDLDRFKLVNDTAGHAAGDALLVEVSKILRSCVTVEHHLARIGGDEFALLLPKCRLELGQEIAVRMVDAISHHSFLWGGRHYDVGASVGLTEITAEQHDPIALMKEADVACYTAKSEGRGKASTYRRDKGSAERRHREIHIAASLQAAIDANRFTLFAQHIRELNVFGTAPHETLEVLVRMRDDDGGMIPPSEFITAAERHGVMHKIDRWVLYTLFNDYRSLLEQNDHIDLSINISASSLDDPFLWPFVRDIISETTIAPSRICFEITETAVINNASVAIKFCRSAREYGCRIALDDFGVGLSSFAYLKNFQVDELKIDGSFIQNIQSSEIDRKLVEAMAGVGRALGIVTVAEWVEDAATLEVVRNIGIDRAQGYHIARPMPLKTVLEIGYVERALAQH
ncbi:EAL domain-containing protein [Acuticoccus sediminis]|nr:PAS domain S-box protein [Acuticoccus sediminis]